MFYFVRRSPGPPKVLRRLCAELVRYRTPWSDSTGLGRVPFRATKPHTQYHYGSVVTHGERHPLGGFAEFPQEVGQRTRGGARVERIDKIPLAGKLKVRFFFSIYPI
ncbi:uncharacterized protein TNCV_2985461 [Trichonephila clavipes]|nr:uncharacterized protein TNCV_2985461 [Trichonephila clavipes]